MTRYRAAPLQSLRKVPLDAFLLVYHRASGITHLVEAPVPEILDAMGDTALSVEQVRVRLAERFDLEDAAMLEERLDELAAAGLIERL